MNAQLFKDRVRQWAARIGVKPTGVYIQGMHTKWASCSTRGRVCFSASLLKEDFAFQNVVIVHELVHLSVPNHGKLFQSLMNAFVPGWQRIVDGRAARLCGYRDDATRFRRKIVAHQHER